MGYSTPFTGVVAREVAPGVTTLSAPFSAFGFLEIGARSTVIRAEFTDGPGAFVIAPLPFTKDSEDAIGGLPVKYIVAPNIVHHMMLKEWQQRFPDARVVGCDVLAERKAKEGVRVDCKVSVLNKLLGPKDLGMDDVLESEGFRFICFGGHKNRELATYHGKSKVLVVADLVFNMPGHEQYAGVSTNAHSWLFGKILQFRNFEDRFQAYLPQMLFANKDEATSSALKAVGALDFDQIVMCHGATVDKDAKAYWAKVFEPFYS